MDFTFTTVENSTEMSLPVTFVFWGYIVAYVIHLIDESLLGETFVGMVQRNFGPIQWRHFFVFNTIFMMLAVASSEQSSRIIKFQEDEGLKDYLQEPFNLKEKWGNLGREEFFALAPILDLEIALPGKISLAENKEDLEMIDFIKKIADTQGMSGLTVLDRKALEEKEPLIHPTCMSDITMVEVFSLI